MKQVYPSHYPQFFTATILNWQSLLARDRYKNIIVESLRFLFVERRIKLNAFVIMRNHIHLIWQALAAHIITRRQIFTLPVLTISICSHIIRNDMNARAAGKTPPVALTDCKIFRYPTSAGVGYLQVWDTCWQKPPSTYQPM